MKKNIYMGKNREVKIALYLAWKIMEIVKKMEKKICFLNKQKNLFFNVILLFAEKKIVVRMLSGNYVT